MTIDLPNDHASSRAPMISLDSGLQAASKVFSGPGPEPADTVSPTAFIEARTGDGTASEVVSYIPSFPMERWDANAQKLLERLVRKKIARTLTQDEATRLEMLKAFRRESVAPRTASEILFDREMGSRLNALRGALEQYVKFVGFDGQSSKAES